MAICSLLHIYLEIFEIISRYSYNQGSTSLVAISLLIIYYFERFVFHYLLNSSYQLAYFVARLLNENALLSMTVTNRK